jgi:hypothetical protein
MTPPQLHMQVETLSRAGIPPISTVVAPGIHGALVAGMHGIGASTPIAAAVAAATLGFASEMHMPNGRMFAIGTWSIMLAAGPLSHITLLVGSTISDDGAKPKLHIITAPVETCCGITLSRHFAFQIGPHAPSLIDLHDTSLHGQDAARVQVEHRARLDLDIGIGDHFNFRRFERDFGCLNLNAAGADLQFN